MALEMELDQKTQKAVSRLASNSDLSLVLTALKNQYTDMLLSTAPDEQQLREECYTKISCYSDLYDWVQNNAE